LRRLHSKSYTVTQSLANYFMSLDEGVRILTISEFLERIDVARGTIQNSLLVLKESGAVKLSSRGKLGTFLDSKDNNILMKFAGIDSIVGVMPLPYTKLYEGLSTGIIESMSVNVPVYMGYMRGAQKRIEMVQNGRYDFAVVSLYAALEFQEYNPDAITIAKRFGKYTYLKGHTLVLRDAKFDKIETGMRVAIDYDSIDQSTLTLSAIEGISVKLIPMSYTQFGSSLHSNEIDAMIWNKDEVARTLSMYKQVDIGSNLLENTEAVLVVANDRLEILKLITDSLNKEEVLRIQKDIEDGLRMPQY
jgi:DNA-binding transcriptional ArsR family regulator